MELYQEILESLSNKYNQRIAENLPLLIEAFTRFYGEKYRQHIAHTLNNAVICYYVAKPHIDFYIREIRYRLTEIRLKNTLAILKSLGFNLPNFKVGVTQMDDFSVNDDEIAISSVPLNNIPKLKSPRIYQILEYLFGPARSFKLHNLNPALINYFELSEEEQRTFNLTVFGHEELTAEELDHLKETQKLIAKITTDTDEALTNLFEFYCAKSIVKSSGPQVFGSFKEVLDKPELQELKEFINQEVQGISQKSDISGMYLGPVDYDTLEPLDLVILDGLCINDGDFIHELNHAVLDTRLAWTETGPLEKCGICVGDDNRKNWKTNAHDLEESLNSINSQEIFEIFQSLGGNIFDARIESINIGSNVGYDYSLPLITAFYQKYKETINTARISENLNSLWRVINPDEFAKFLALFNRILSQGRKITKWDISQMESIVSQMDVPQELPDESPAVLKVTPKF